VAGGYSQQAKPHRIFDYKWEASPPNKKILIGGGPSALKARPITKNRKNMGFLIEKSTVVDSLRSESQAPK